MHPPHVPRHGVQHAGAVGNGILEALAVQASTLKSRTERLHQLLDNQSLVRTELEHVRVLLPLLVEESSSGGGLPLLVLSSIGLSSDALFFSKL